MIRRILLIVGALALASLIFLYFVGRGALGEHEAPGEVTSVQRPAPLVEQQSRAIDAAASEIGAAASKQILFGDLHVHTTFSFDAFLQSLPFLQGEGAHPPADACDFARFCSGLDFWSINDHAEGITPRHWRETTESIRQCNAVAGDSQSPDTVAFLGWEWTDVGTTRDDHYGHKNVVLAHTDPERIPTRPIAASSTVRRARVGDSLPLVGIGGFALATGEERIHDLARFFYERRGWESCEKGVAVRDLPADCRETADTPAELYAKLRDWGHDSIVIPHGTTWGLYTPSASTWDGQLAGDMHDPFRQTLLEIYSGHGNSDVYRDWRAVEYDAAGVAHCPAPRADYLPRCWRAGEIIRARCSAEGGDDRECEKRAASAREFAAAALNQAHLTVPGTDSSEWLDAGQCRDCDEPAFNYRPGGSAQYIMALGNFDEAGEPRRFRFGFMSSSDNHSARPGTGYKEVHRFGFTESQPRGDTPLGAATNLLGTPEQEPSSQPRPFDRENTKIAGFALFEMERQASFFMTGGLVAAHAEGRDREAVWSSLQRREVYGTSGPRMLLWFDLVNPPGTRGRPVAMGGEVEMIENPIFQVRAVGSFEQLPGCPDYAVTSLGAERLENVCKGECYHPSDHRRLITRIEVVRIRPQQERGESIAELIDDPWKTFDCEPDARGCAVSFTDPDYALEGRDALYYARAFEEPAPAINAGGVRCDYDASGRCVEANLCLDVEDECRSIHEPKAWSSPIFVDWLATKIASTGPASDGR